MTRKLGVSRNRRRILQAVGATGAVALAGCLGDDEPAADGTEGEAAESEEVEGEATELLSLDEGPAGEPISEADVQTLVDIFDDQPFNDAQLEQEGEDRDYTPSHVWKWVSDETVIALHVNEPNPEDADDIMWIVIGQKGVFTEESQPAPEFTHFHQREADGWEDGHGASDPEAEGYWLTHITTRDFEAPAWEAELGVDYDFMPTPPEEGSTGTADFDVGGQGQLGEENVDALLDVFDDAWTNEAQHEADGNTPAHVWKWITEDVFMFLHPNEPNPEEADGLWYFGLGTRGQFVDADRPNPPEGVAVDGEDFTHFHLWEADSWDAGHGGQSTDQHGAWLVHHAVQPLEMPWGDVEVGVDRNFNVTPPEE